MGISLLLKDQTNKHIFGNDLYRYILLLKILLRSVKDMLVNKGVRLTAINIS